MKKLLIFIIILPGIGLAQVQKSGNLQTHIDSIITNMPDAVGSNEYQHPTILQLNNWGEIIDSVLAANYSSAHTLASSFGYRITEFTDNSVSPNGTYYILQNNPGGTTYWGTYIFNPSPERSKIIIQSPHPKKDFNTGKQGFYVFREIGARAFFLSGATRCSSTDTTTCDGTTTVCSGSSSAYPISDQAHTTTGTFQRTTERMLTDNADLIFIQFHGFAKQASDPSAIMSNGVQNDTPPTDYLSTLKDNLLAEDDTLTFKIAHIDLGWNRLLGTTNTQGRLINGSGDPCETSASVNTGQFLHLEQVKVGLRENETQWTKMANALATTFTPDALPVELVSFSGELTEKSVILNWQTATEVNNYGFEVERQYQDSSEWEKIGFVQGNGTTNSPKQYSFADPLNLSLNPNLDRIDYRLKQIDNDGTFAYSKIVTVDLSTITDIDKEEIPTEFSLSQNYPNPFNPSTTINYEMPITTNVVLKVFDVLGNEVVTLVNKQKTPGIYKVKFDASSLSSGIYLYRLTASDLIQSRKMLFLK